MGPFKSNMHSIAYICKDLVSKQSYIYGYNIFLGKIIQTITGGFATGLSVSFLWKEGILFSLVRSIEKRFVDYLH